nr:NAD(P)H-binding protein [Saccharopolyspora sp. HNM0983]
MAVFGATGATGRQVLQQALAAGHAVTAVARDPAALDGTHPQLRVVRGDVAEPGQLGAAVDGADAVVSALGSRDRTRPAGVYSAGTAAVLAAMREAGVRRIVAVTAEPLIAEQDKTALERLVVHPLLHRVFGAVYADMRRMEHVLADSDAEWTVLRPPRLTDRAGTGRYRTAIDEPLPRARSLPRADLADALLRAAADPTLIRSHVTIAS